MGEDGCHHHLNNPNDIPLDYPHGILQDNPQDNTQDNPQDNLHDNAQDNPQDRTHDNADHQVAPAPRSLYSAAPESRIRSASVVPQPAR